MSLVLVFGGTALVLGGSGVGVFAALPSFSGFESLPPTLTWVSSTATSIPSMDLHQHPQIVDSAPDIALTDRSNTQRAANTEDVDPDPPAAQVHRLRPRLTGRLLQCHTSTTNTQSPRTSIDKASSLTGAESREVRSPALPISKYSLTVKLFTVRLPPERLER